MSEHSEPHIDTKEAFALLLRAGLTTRDIGRLCGFYRKYRVSELDQASIDRRRLEFVR
jgi:hypothetical protein